MREPWCKIEWFHEGYQAIWLVDGTDASPEDVRAICIKMAEASQGAETVTDLSLAVERVASSLSLVAKVYPEASHSDPACLHVSVGLLPSVDRRARRQR